MAREFVRHSLTLSCVAASLLVGLSCDKPPPAPVKPVTSKSVKPPAPPPKESLEEPEPPDQPPSSPRRETLPDVRAGVVAGRIVDDDEKPVEGLEVKLLQGRSAQDRKEVAKLKTTATGNFEFEGLPDDWYVLDVEARKPEPQEITEVLDALPEGMREHVQDAWVRSVEPFGRFWLHGEKGINLGTLRWLKRGAVIRVRVFNEGELFPFWSVFAWRPPSRILIPQRLPDRDGAGFIFLPSAAKGYSTYVVVHTAASNPIRLVTIERGWGLADVRFDCESNDHAVVSGSLKDDRGQVVDGAWVFLYDDVRDAGSWSRFQPVRSANGGYRFTIGSWGVPVGRYRLAVFRNDLPVAIATARVVDEPGGRPKPVSCDIVIMASATGTVSGEIDFAIGGMKVRDIARAEIQQGGRLPLWQFGVYVVPEKGSNPFPYVPRAVVKYSDQPMRFECRGIAPGRYRLLVRPVEQVWDGVAVDFDRGGELQIPLPETWAPGGLFGLSIRAESKTFQVASGKPTDVTVDPDLSAEDLSAHSDAPTAVIRSRLEAMKVQLETGRRP